MVFLTFSPMPAVIVGCFCRFMAFYPMSIASSRCARLHSDFFAMFFETWVSAAIHAVADYVPLQCTPLTWNRIQSSFMDVALSTFHPFNATDESLISDASFMCTLYVNLGKRSLASCSRFCNSTQITRTARMQSDLRKQPYALVFRTTA